MPDSNNLAPATSVKHQNQLVQSYLDSLLSDVTATQTEESIAWPAEDLTPQSSPAQQESIPDVLEHSGVSAPEITETTATESEAGEGQVNTDLALSAAAEHHDGHPKWAEETFASLLFEVAGNDLAAPLHELGGICPLTDNLKHLAGQADWFLGLLNWNGRQLRVVDTARLLMAESHLESSLEEDYQSVIILGNSNWALAVNRADQSIRLDPQDVKWREHRGNRYWLAGTLQDQLSSLIDVSALRRHLDSMDTSLNALSEKTGTNPA